jgi:antagonist of KipI
MTDPISATLRLLSAGLCTLVVDAGRPRSRSLGVPVGGAADRRSLALGNALVGNPPDAAALEICLAGPTLVADCSLACVLYGAPFDLATDLRRLVAGHTFTLEPGEELRMGSTADRVRAYLCIHGGVLVPETLGSRSGFAPLRVGDELPVLAGQIDGRFLPPEAEESYDEPVELRVLDGSQAAWFHLDELLGEGAVFHVSTDSNRMGLRLTGRPLTAPARDIVSEPVCPGTVQVTREGQCIVLGVDGQTIGGYPKIAQVIAADLDKLGQLRPGAAVCFRRVTLAEAETAYRERRREMLQWIRRLRVTTQ